MAVPSLSFVVGLLVLAYLGSFVLFAFIRVTTGVSIQRIGYTGLRRIAYTPRDGIKIELRGLGLNLHRPTFAQPTWLSVVLTELKITVDLKQLGTNPPKRPGWVHWPNPSSDKLDEPSTPISPSFEDDGIDDSEERRSRTWERLTETKEKIKRLHRKIQWIKLVDVVATSSSLVVVDVASVQVSHFTMAIDTRRKTVDRSRLFQHRKTNTDERRPAEWIFTVRSILLTPEGSESAEILDHCTLNVHGFLYKELDGLRDASIALKLGRLNIPYDEINTAVDRSKRCRSLHHRRRGTNASESDISFSDVIEELDQPGSREENIVRTVSDSKEFVASILRGIQEIQFAVSYLGLTKRIRSSNAAGAPVWLNVSMKEVGLDLVRLDQKSPAHLQYFSRNDVAHQALLAAIAVSVGIDDGREDHERLLYIPMATATVKTTLPSKTIQYQREKNVAERNANILFANLVATSPSLDLDPKHLPLVLDLLQSHEKSTGSGPSKQTKRHLISKLLPKASIKLSIHEPVVRVTLPPMEKEKQGTDEFDLLISAMSNISLDVESSHSAGGELHYSLASDFRVQSHQLYYQTASSEKHNLLLTESLEVKVQVSASPEVAVVASGDLQTFSIYMVRPEIAEGIRQIVVQLRSETSPMRRYHKHMTSKVSFLRRLPSWLQHVSFTGSDFSVEVAGVDPQVSDNPKGVAVHLESWNAEYKADRGEEPERQHTRRRATSRTFQRDDHLKPSTPPSSPRRKLTNANDGRRLAIHVQGLEGFVVESADTWEPEPFLGLPRFEVAFSTSSDNSGPIFHVNSFAKSLFFHYSMYRHFCIGVATLVVRKAFQPPVKKASQTTYGRSLAIPNIEVEELGDMSNGKPELTTIDLKAAFVQIKGTMPNEPPLMMQIQDLEGGRHRWAPPFFRARLTRLYADTPRMPGVWSRVVSVKNVRVDLRRQRRKSGGRSVEERSIDVATDAIRLAVPHQLVMHKIFDNFANLTKTVQQLHHRFHTGTDEYILDKEPEKPKNVPKISFRSQAVLFEIEDGSFEWKLGVIYRLGLLEQKQRLAREEAFRLKVKKLEEIGKTRGSVSYKARAKSTHEGRSRIRRMRTSVKGRSKSEHASDEDDQSPTRKTREMRYDMDGKAAMTGSTQMDIEEARERLQKLNAQTWKKRIDHGLNIQTRTMKDIRSIFWGLDEMPDDVTQQREVIMAISQRPALMAMLVSDFSLVIDKPSFPVSQYSTFLHRIGKGMPLDQKYSLLIPLNVQVNMGEVRVTLRDYPLPLLHVPAIRSGQSPRLPSFSLKTDFVIAEEFQDHESMRYAHVVVVPAQTDDTGKAAKGFSVRVPRTVSPVKTYSDMRIEINTSSPTRFTWGTSYQPAIQDMMQVIESFTKPAIDPSERVGFWDKIRLSFHSRVNVHWKGDGDVHLILKGSRDPYMVTGHGAGFVMCWRNDVRWSLCQHDDPKKFMTVDSGSYVLAIPDLGHYARILADPEVSDADSVHSGLSQRHGASFKKTIMKLSGRVQWLAGLVFERNVDGAANRSFDFIPHYKVVLKNPEFAKCANDKVYDAFRGFRSNHIHLSIAVAAPHDRDWSVANLKPSSNYNSVHLSPRFFSHFFNWWSMFSGAMSLPIRQGKLWPGVEKSSKKFGRHLATIKYNLLLSPLFMSHIYKHKDNDGTDNGAVSATGLKVRLDSFMLDLHQRREEFKTLVQGPRASGNDKSNQTTGMKIHEAQLDFIAADIRAVSALVNAPTSNDLDEATDEMLASYQTDGAATPVDLSNFTIPDKDLKWIDMDDFVELDWILPTEAVPQTQILPLAFAPRFTYFRQTDHQGHISGDPSRHSHFGKEPTHFCVMSARNDPRRVQRDLIEERLMRVIEQLDHNNREIGEQELKIVRESTSNEQLNEGLRILQKHSDALRRKQAFLQSAFDTLDMRLRTGDRRAVPDIDDGAQDEYFEARENSDAHDPDVKGIDSAPFADYISDFNNRFIVHNVQLKWNNSLRNIILRYIHEVSQRRGFVYYMSRKAVKFILDIVEEQGTTQYPNTNGNDGTSSGEASHPMSPISDNPEIQDRIQQLVDDAKKFVRAEDSERNDDEEGHVDPASKDIALEFTAQNSYHLRLIAPQIQLQSEKNRNAAVLVTAKGMQLKVISIMDKERVSDSVSGLVQRRFTAAMDSLQMFVTNSKTFSTDYLHMYSGSRYGAPHGTSWPPWVPFEVMFEFELNPYGFQRVVKRTSASLRFDKYNDLRLKYNDDVTGGDKSRRSLVDSAENRMDHLWIDFPHLRAICDSAQYYSLYIIVLDLLLYSEPLEKTRNERLEKIMLASDFSNLSGAPEMVIMLQERIRQLEEIKTHFQINEKYLDRQGWRDRLAMEQDLASCEDELFFMMKAITTSQRRMDDRAKASESEGILRWYIAAQEIVWHLVREGNEPLAEFQLKDASFDRTNNNDGSNNNTVEIGRVQGLNLLSNALYPEMISPFIEEDGQAFKEGQDARMLRVNWLMLEPIAGIPVVNHFEVNLFPLKVQLEKEIGLKLFEYVFPKQGKKGSEQTVHSPFMVRNMLPSQQEEDEDEHSDEHSSRHSPEMPSIEEQQDDNSIGVGSLELRLQPTLNLPDARRRSAQSSNQSQRDRLHGLGLFRESTGNSRGSIFRKHDVSTDTLTTHPTRPSSVRSPSIMSSIGQPSTSSNSFDGGRPNKFRLTRVNSTAGSTTTTTGKKEGRSDDLTQMMSRASSYMTLAYVKIPSLVLCLSYKGKGQRNFEDVHNLVFRMPTLEYRNKTWSNLDLALQLKKDVTRALISHTGAIIGNKFSHHRPSKLQQSKLRQIANSSALLSSAAVQKAQASPTGLPSSTSPYTTTPANASDTSLSEPSGPPRKSFTSGRASLASQPASSYASSMHSGWAPVEHNVPSEEEFQGEAVKFADELGRVDVMEPETVRHTLSRHLTTLSQRTRGAVGEKISGLSPLGNKHESGRKLSAAGDGAEDVDGKSVRRKSKMLLGKKLLEKLPGHKD